MLKVGSLFSGIGGIEYGLELTGGFKTIWQAEINPFCSRILEKHWPGCPNLGDVTRVDWGGIEKPDLICGGFPCQDISYAGKGKGILKGARSRLWSEFARSLRELQPKYALVENVPALAKRGLWLVLADLASAGYNAEWGIISAASVGAPHLRERLFVIAYHNRLGCLGGGGVWEGGYAQAHENGPLAALPEGRQGERLSSDSEVPPASHSHGAPTEDQVRAGGKQFNAFSLFAGCKSAEDFKGRSDIPQPLIRGGADGLPDRVERVKALGNAVVPQVAQVIGEYILKIDSEV